MSSESEKKVVIAEVVMKNFSPCGPRNPVIVLIEKDVNDFEAGYPTATARFVEYEDSEKYLLHVLQPTVKAIAEAHYYKSF